MSRPQSTDSNVSCRLASFNAEAHKLLEKRLNKLSLESGYPISQMNGQRRYGPPPDWNGSEPPKGCEVFIGKLPRHLMEDEIIPIFEKIGKLYLFRLMMDFSGTNRGYAFATYTNKQDARRAVVELDGFPIRPNHSIGVVLSVDNCRLYIGKIPRQKTADEVRNEICRLTDGVVKVILYPSVNDRATNRGFAFVEYKNHQIATVARRKLLPGQTMWGVNVEVDWAEPEMEPDEEIIAKAKNLYVRNLPLSIDEKEIKEIFEAVTGKGSIEHVKKLKDYAFVHFFKRDDAVRAMNKMNGEEIDGFAIEVVWAKPVDQNVKRLKSGVLQMHSGLQQRSASAFPAGGQQPLLLPLAAPPSLLNGGQASIALSSQATLVSLAGSPGAVPFAGMPFIDPSAGTLSTCNLPRRIINGMRSAGTHSFSSCPTRRSTRKTEAESDGSTYMWFDGAVGQPGPCNGFANMSLPPMYLMSAAPPLHAFPAAHLASAQQMMK